MQICAPHFLFFSSRRRHTRCLSDWSSDVCSSDLLSTSLGPLVAHEAYPGHHTEHVRKEAGLLRRHRCWEESIVVIGTPHNLLSEGLADHGFEIVMGPRREAVVAEHLAPLGIPYDPDVVTIVRQAGEALAGVRANAAFRLWEDGADPDTVIDEVARFELTSRALAPLGIPYDPDVVTI